MLTSRVIVAGLLTCVVVVVFVVLGLPPGHSAPFNYAWSVQYFDALSWSDPLPRYLPGLWAGFGGHDFFFYAPLPFWFLAIFVDPLCPGCAVSTEFVLGSSIILVASGSSMFAFLSAFFGYRPALFGAIAYVLLPYHLLIDWFERQSAGEFTAYVFLPLVALGIERLRRNEPGGVVMAIGIAGLALSHLPTTLLAAHAFAILVLIFVGRQPGEMSVKVLLLARFTWFGLLGLAMASFYWLPTILLLDSVSASALFDPYFEAWRWLLGSSEPNPNPAFALRIAACLLACLPFVLGSVIFARGPILAWILVPVLFAVFMNTAASELIWREWIISKVQFPWRLMAPVDLATGIAVAVVVDRVHQKTGKQVLALGLMACLSVSTSLVITATYSLRHSTPEELYSEYHGAIEYLSPEMTKILQLRIGQPTIGHFDQKAAVIAMIAVAAEFKKTQGPNALLSRGTRSLTVLPPFGTAVLSLPVQYWSLWTAQTASGATLEVRANPTFGTIDIIAPAEGFSDQPVTVSLPLQASELWGLAVSLLAVLALMVSLHRRR